MEFDEQPNLETLIACSVKKLISCDTLGVIRGEKRESFTKVKTKVMVQLSAVMLSKNKVLNPWIAFSPFGYHSLY